MRERVRERGREMWRERGRMIRVEKAGEREKVR